MYKYNVPGKSVPEFNHSGFFVLFYKYILENLEIVVEENFLKVFPGGIGFFPFLLSFYFEECYIYIYAT